MGLLREDLEQVPWVDMTHAYGSAIDTPGHLIDLLSNDANIRAKAMGALWASICHQGSVYEASCAAVPFLIRILREGPLAGRPSVLYLLAGLAHRDWHAYRNVRERRMVHTFDEEHGNQWHYSWWCPGEFLKEGNKYHELEWMTRAHLLVSDGISDYFTLLTAEDDVTAQAAAHLIVAFPEKGEPVIAAIDQQLVDRTQAGDAVREADALLDLGALLPSDSPLWDRHRSRLSVESHSNLLVRYAAAVALARFLPTHTPSEAIAMLIDAVVEPQLLDERHDLLTNAGYAESVHTEACQLLSQLPSPQGVEALATALDRGAERWRILDTVRVAEALLDAAFFSSWIADRYWSHTAPDADDVSVERMAQDMISGDKHPYDDRSYHQYGCSYNHVEAFVFKLECFGYVHEEADRIREHILKAEKDVAFTSDQRHALKAILRCAPLWSVDHDLLDIYGLPREREALEKLLV